MRIPNGDGIFYADFVDESLNGVIEKGRIRVRRTVQMKNSARTLLVITNHVDVDHRQDSLQILGVLVEMVSDP